MKKVTAVIVLALIFSQGIKAQAPDDSINVSRAMLDYIEGFYEGDSSKITQSISPEVVKYGYWKNAGTGKYEGRAMSFRQMIDFTINVKTKNKQAKPGTIKKVQVFEVQDQTASGKVTASWGTDYILLEKVNEKWMIRSVLWQGPPKN